MGFYDNASNVDQYIEMCRDQDGSNIYAVLQEHLPAGSSVLELGSGLGFNISFLSKHDRVTGSDFSDEFLIRCRAKHPGVAFLKINAAKMHTFETFDCIYSNKVDII